MKTAEKESSNRSHSGHRRPAETTGFGMLFGLAALAVALILLGTAQPALAEPPTADFDWSMPARTGLDANGDGVIDSLNTQEQIDPGTFTVNFNACASTGSIVRYRWTINLKLAGEVADCSGFSQQLGEGVYTVTLETVSSDGSTASLTKRVTVQDWLIVAVGDSYGSGEGNPEKLADWTDPFHPKPAVWQNEGCHRSHISGQAMAAKKIEDDDPHTSVTLVHLSCSGATIGGVKSQLENLKDLIGDREIDALLVSVGGNDVQFSRIVTDCILTEPCDQYEPAPKYIGLDALHALCDFFALVPGDLGAICNDWINGLPQNTESAAQLFHDGLLNINTAGLHTEINSFPVLKDHPGRVYWAEYPNATEDSNGNPCYFSTDTITTMLPGISSDESAWVRDTMTEQLNQTIKDTAGLYKWTYVDGIFDAFHKHGYCADQYWLNRIGESFLKQLDKNGTLHPNAQGHEVYRDKIWEKLKSDLYILGNLNQPRSPLDNVPPIVTGVPDRSPNAAGWYNQDVIIDWQATDPPPSSGLPNDPPDTTASTEGLKVPYTSDLSCDGVENCTRGSLLLSIDKTPPVISGSKYPGPNSDGWNNSNVTVSFQCEDQLSLIAACPDDIVLSGEGAGQSVDGTAVDNAGNSAKVAVADINIDRAAPVVTAALLPSPNSDGWNNTSVQVSFSGTDNLSGIKSCDSPVELLLDGKAQEVTGTCTDFAGNTGEVTAYVNIDQAVPMISGAQTPDANSYGWNNTDVTVSFDCNDQAELSLISSCTQSVVLTQEGAGQSVEGEAVDHAGNSAMTTVSNVNIDKTVPVVNGLQLSVNPKSVAEPSILTVSATDDLSGVVAGEYRIDQGDPLPLTVDENSITATIGTSLTPGVYAVGVQVEDAAGNWSEPEVIFLVVYDPDGAFASGGGWITSPPGAYAMDPALTGMARFGFYSKYKSGATVPTGEAEFHFKAGDLNFFSTSYEWLVVAGAKAQFKGSGTINGDGDYGFLLTARDSALPGGGDEDSFRIKIWDKATGEVVYDNQPGEADDSDTLSDLGGGNIVIHK